MSGPAGFNRVVIVGVGLIGGSLARALKDRGLAGEIAGLDLDLQNLRQALDAGVVDMACRTPEEVGDADLLVVATPVTCITQVVAELLPHCPPGAVITDVGSVKAPVVRAVEEILPEDRCFVGGHPVSGTERAGVLASFAELFEGRRVILTPTERTSEEALERVAGMWRGVGAHVIFMDLDKHDMIMAAISHLPHLVAYALVNTIWGMDDYGENLLNYAAGGFTDFTRIASSNPVMWRDICLANREAVLEVIERYEKMLMRLKEYVNQGKGSELYREFALSKLARDAALERIAAGAPEKAD